MTTPTSAAQPDPASPSDAALPVDVQAALNFLCDPFQTHVSSGVTVAQKAALVRTYIAALRSENAALTAERDRLAGDAEKVQYAMAARITEIAAERDEAKKQAEIAVNSQRTICRAAERLTAERDALRGEVEDHRGALVDCWKNDATRYDYGDRRRGDDAPAPAGQRWQTPREIVANFLRSKERDIWDEISRLQSESALGGEGAE